MEVYEYLHRTLQATHFIFSPLSCGASNVHSIVQVMCCKLDSKRYFETMKLFQKQFWSCQDGSKSEISHTLSSKDKSDKLEMIISFTWTHAFNTIF